MLENDRLIEPGALIYFDPPSDSFVEDEPANDARDFFLILAVFVHEGVHEVIWFDVTIHTDRYPNISADGVCVSDLASPRRWSML
jgi:hypothetical protein